MICTNSTAVNKIKEDISKLTEADIERMIKLVLELEQERNRFWYVRSLVSPAFPEIYFYTTST